MFVLPSPVPLLGLSDLQAGQRPSLLPLLIAGLLVAVVVRTFAPMPDVLSR